MFSSVAWGLFIILILILGNGFFSAAELAIISARRGRLQQQAEEGDRASRLALALASDPNRFLPAVQVGITLVQTFVAAFGGATLEGVLADQLAQSSLGFVAAHPHTIALGIVSVGIAAAQLILGELVPKRLALINPEAFARFVAPMMEWMARIGRPVIWLMGIATNSVLWILRVKPNENAPSVSVDDIEHLIDAGTAEGILKPVEQQVALEALRLGERSVRDIMRPRIDLDALDVNTPPDEVVGAVAMAGFSRLPVYERDLDRIIGFVHIKDLFRQVYLGWPIQLRKMLHPALFVPVTMPLDRLLEMFQLQHNQLAVVLDEYGGTQGIVTLEDVVEELVGEIRDEHRRDEAQQIVQRDDSSWLIDGQVSIADMLDQLHLKDPDPAGTRGFSTVSGLILDRLGRIPNVGDRAQWHGLELEVVDMDGQRIDRMLVSRPSVDGEASKPSKDGA